jgi:hypothetical protein
MAHLQAFRAAVDGKRRGNKPNRTAEIFANARRLVFAAVAFFLTCPIAAARGRKQLAGF